MSVYYLSHTTAPSAPAAASAVAEAEPPRKPRSQTLIYTVTGAGTKECVAGKPARFEVRKRVMQVYEYSASHRLQIHCKDEHGVPQTSLAKLEVLYLLLLLYSSLSLSFSAFRDPGSQVSFSGPRSVYAPAVNEDPARRGVYFVEYRVVVPGTYQMRFFLSAFFFFFCFFPSE